jgi:SAM-dependent methyltransferase
LVPDLLDAGYDAIGVDPEAPDGAHFVPVAFEDAVVRPPVHAVVACVSLHHVDDLDRVLNGVAKALVPRGVVVVVEWGWERFDDATARWCFDRLLPAGPGANAGWLERRREEWAESGLPWDAYLEGWATKEGLHPAADILTALDRRFTGVWLDDMPYFFCDLAETSRAAEEAAIGTGAIRAAGLRYVGIVA